jgi:hypothetical protein
MIKSITECEDLAGTVAALEARGVPFVARLSQTADGYRTATFVDLEGNRLRRFRAGPAVRHAAGIILTIFNILTTFRTSKEVDTWWTRLATSLFWGPVRPG